MQEIQTFPMENTNVTEKKIILFSIGTEFHYLVAMSIIDNHFSGREFEFILLLHGNPLLKNKRLGNINFDSKHRIINVDYIVSDNKPNKQIKAIILGFKKQVIFHYISFMYHDAFSVYLSYYFSKQGINCSLAPDGMIAYVKWNGKNPRSRLINTLDSYKFFLLNNLFFPRIWITSWQFAANGYFKNIFSFLNAKPVLPSKKEITEFSFSFDQARVKELDAIFHVRYNPEISFKDSILIINTRNKGIEEYEKILIEKLLEINPDRIILYKKHPNYPIENLDFLNYLPNMVIFNDIFPVELLIARMHHSVIISSYSTSMLYLNNDCRYFWTYPILQNMGILKKPVTRTNPTTHIQVMSNFDALISEIEGYFNF